ncbi:hypothetical protein [Lihuaxuella thermophila]|uniref:Uncharacterized protein n=1 Tax=Lihuaxuella thermophila TaxID=1173111 RepID=A0A1H8CI13_9BACL|nr:hypothetical protein [Lihuaxuella thermophila]SEM94650.1 hypothetical protein SAMN05444955_103317 [Lihuaxuella thermophila]
MNEDRDSKVLPDYSLIQPLSIPADSKVPDDIHGSSTPTEYDLYFRLLRSSPDLIEWSRACLSLYEKQTRDLDKTSLEDKDKYEILLGWLVVFQVTLERWVKICEASGKGT